jgi:hypothetical protein
VRAVWIVAATPWLAGCSLIDLSTLSSDGAGGDVPVGGATTSTTTQGGDVGTGGATSTPTSASSGGTGGIPSASGSSSSGCSEFCDGASGSAFCDSFLNLNEWTSTNGANVTATATITNADFTSCPSALSMEISAAPSATWAQRKHAFSGVPSQIDVTFKAKIVSAATEVSFFETAWATSGWYCQMLISRNASGVFSAVQALDVNNNYTPTQLGTVFITGPRATSWTSFEIDLDLNARDFKLTADGMDESTSLTSHPCLTAPDADSTGIFFGTVYDMAPAELLYDDLVAKIN